MATLLIMALPEESQKRFEHARIEVHYCGIGMLNAAYITHKLITEQNPSKIINLGTAGSFKLKKGDLVECSSFVQRFASKSVIPGYQKIESANFITKLQKVVCGTGDFIQTEESTYFDIMDMEAYAMAYVCKKLNVNFHAIKFISDNSNENTLSDWKKNLEQASEALFQTYQDLKIK
jgi:adenosylhomocysteine nucleosidase